MKTYLSQALVLLVSLSSASRAEDINDTTNSQFAAEIRVLSGVLESPPETNGLWDDAILKMWQHKISVDRLGPFALEGITFGQFAGHDVWKHNVALGRGVIVDTVVDGFRDAAGDTVPYEDWLDSWGQRTNGFFARAVIRPVASFFTGLIDGSVGNTEEEELKFGLPTTSEIALSRWQQAKRQYELRYGVHDTYGYLTAKIGDICYVDTRLQASLSGFDMSALTRVLRLSGQLTFPLPWSGRFIVGGAIYPEEYAYSQGFDHANYGPSFGVRYEHSLIVHGKQLGSGALGWSEDAHGRLFAFQYVYSF